MLLLAADLQVIRPELTRDSLKLGRPVAEWQTPAPKSTLRPLLDTIRPFLKVYARFLATPRDRGLAPQCGPHDFTAMRRLASILVKRFDSAQMDAGIKTIAKNKTLNCLTKTLMDHVFEGQPLRRNDRGLGWF